jgi:solute carrier family 35, member E1
MKIKRGQNHVEETGGAKIIHFFRNNFRVIAIIFVWYLCQITATATNKSLLKKGQKVLPLTLGFINFLVAIVLDYLLLNFSFGDISLKQVKTTVFSKWKIMLPTIISMIASKYLSLLAYKLISVALFQTLKATSPFALVVISKLWLNKSYPAKIYISLIPILAGAMLAASGDYEFNIVGAIAAIIATCCGSFQRIYIKLNILPATPETDLWSSLRTTVLGHFELAICATIGIFPLAFVEEILYGNILYIPLTKIIFGATLQWVASLCAWQGLAVLEPLSQNIAKIVQRICSIIVTIYLFDKKVSALNRNGMILAFFGVALYSYVQQKKKKLPPDTVANNDKLRGLELGLSKTKKLDTSI